MKLEEKILDFLEAHGAGEDGQPPWLTYDSEHELYPVDGPASSHPLGRR